MSQTSFYALAGDTYYEQLGYASIEAVGTRAVSPKKPVDCRLLSLPMRYNASRAATVRRAWVIRVVTLLDVCVLTACAIVLKNDWLLLLGLAIVIGGWIAALQPDKFFINIGLAPAGEIAS
jgi:hypothetical protein